MSTPHTHRPAWARLRSSRAYWPHFAIVAATALLLGACSAEPTPGAGASSVPKTSTSAAPSTQGPESVNVGGVALRIPQGYFRARAGETWAQVERSGGGEGMNMFEMGTVVDAEGRFIPAPPDALNWLRSQDNFLVEDLGTIRVSGQEVPVARVSNSNDAPFACAPGVTTANNTCFYAGSPGPVYGFVKNGDRTVVLERSSLQELQDWAPMLTIVPS